ncbi:MAG: GTPase ObgE [Smithellaceae bacterium]|jgi:GTP-binding protein|nr:GTPase ObgE [Smithellaceae bacterium]HBJ74305.1 GTPase ObgE [Syntrophaceae bacterium]HBL54247.1 GTPase ObgE [Syntrophaceae bacterium]HCS76213.1 GTPase ObgE [Syntrophaceae bacterium]HCX02637.1 GTPase ObgE [Syntrophaceae bacterium]
MKFVDEAKIFVKGGHGGAGCVSFRREKFVPKGGPDGGDGGKGGDVIFRASKSHHTLLDLKYQQHQVAKNGGHGSGNNRTGRSAVDLEVIVPPGTVVKDYETGEILADLSELGQTFIVAKGGIGGKGNAHFKTSTHQTPRFAQEGMDGEERWLKMELKLLADVGLVGFPNAGKSTFISRVSAARPKIADYPFTTLTPHLGVVKYADAPSFVVADIPGLIAGAHEGLGMGIQFLRHVERTALLVHLIDISQDPHTNAWKNFTALTLELESYNPQLLAKAQIVCLNKIDLPAVREKVKKSVAQFQKKGIILHPFSAATGEGLQDILGKIVTLLNNT